MTLCTVVVKTDKGYTIYIDVNLIGLAWTSRYINFNQVLMYVKWTTYLAENLQATQR